MKMLRMVAAVYMQMEEKETQEEAEDRLIELIEDAGMEVYSWWNVETVENHDEEFAKELSKDFLIEEVHKTAKQFRRSET